VSEYFFEEEEDEESEYTPGSLITVVGWDGKKFLYTILAKWKINSHQYMYRLLTQSGKVYETYCELDYWSKVG
jgi:hypothetical protein